MNTETTGTELYSTREVMAAEAVELPTEIEVLQEDAWNGMDGRPDFEVTASDIDDYVNNYKTSPIQPDIPMDIEHGEDPHFGKRAPGWIKDVYAKTKENGKRALYVKPEFNQLGTDLVKDKQFKYVSAEFYPRSLGGKKDPEGKGVLSNILRAVTITNRPLMKKLPALMASEDAGKSTSVLTYQLRVGTINSNEGAENVNLAAIIGKDPATVSASEKTFLAEHKSEMSTADQIKFGLAEADTTVTATDVTIKASELAAKDAKIAELEAKVTASEGLEGRMAKLEIAANAGVKASEELANTKAQAIVDEQIKRGALKSDQRDFWTGQLVKASETDRTALEASLKELPSNEILASAKGDDTANAGGGASKQLIEKADEVVKASEGKTNFNDALMRVRGEHKELAKEADLENTTGEAK